MKVDLGIWRGNPRPFNDRVVHNVSSILDIRSTAEPTANPTRTRNN